MRHVSLPNHMYVWADNRYLTGGAKGGTTPAVLHAVYGRPGEALLTHLLLETGAHWSGVPIHGIYHKPDATPAPLARCQPWSNMGSHMEAVHLPYLDGLQVTVQGRRGRATGTVIDWSDGFTRHPHMHKPLHMLLMDDGTLSFQPNNYIRWEDPSFVDESTWNQTADYRRGEVSFYPEDKT